LWQLQRQGLLLLLQGFQVVQQCLLLLHALLLLGLHLQLLQQSL
jgi:hypothetical protein